MATLEVVKKELEFYFKDYEFTLGKRIYGSCIIAKKSKYNGADIFIKNGEIRIEAGIPKTKTRLMIGGGAVLLKMFSKSYTEPSIAIYEYLSQIYEHVYIRD